MPTVKRAADIRLLVDGELTAAHGGSTTRLEAAGSALSWHIEDLSAILPGLPTTGRSSVARVAEALAGYGLTLSVVDARGVLIELGDSKRSILGRLLFGAPTVRPRRPLQLLIIAARVRRTRR